MRLRICRTVTGGTVTLGTVTAASPTFNPFDGSYTLAGGSLALNGGLTMNSGSGAVNLGTSVTLGGTQSFANHSARLLTVSGSLANDTHLLTIDGTGDTAIAGKFFRVEGTEN